MQDIHSIGGGGERPFGSGDRRLRPHHNQNHQPLKCPRCDSLNTKFCYYNNYNLAQPRHFCKSCRRYWTKGGVLRNVPVGGGCRKTKRSKPKASSDAQRDRRSNSHSSSESSSLTGSTTAATTTSNAATAISEVVSATTSTSASTLLNFPESRFFLPRTTNPSPHTTANPNFGLPLIDRPSDGRMFPDIGSFTNLISSSNDPSPLGFKFNVSDIPSYRLHQNSHGHVVQDQGSDHQRPEQHNGPSTVADELKMQEITSGFLYQTDQIEPPELQNRTGNGGVAALDWQAGGDQALFDLTGTVDQAYWSQTQWTDNDLYLP